MTTDQIFNLIFSVQIWMLAKFFVCFALVLYLVFAFVMIRQVQLMTDALPGQLEWVVKSVAFFHFIFAAFVLLLAVVIL